MSYLALDGIGKRYGDTPVLSGFSLTVEAGELITLLGPSGCGKTTTLRIVAGFAEPDGGSVSLAGRSLNGVPAHRRNIGVVFQSYALFPHMTAEGNVAFGLKMRGIGRAERDRRVSGALTLVGLGTFGDRFPSELSGGQQQRVALARALVVEPDVLLLDEPLSNLDAGLRAGMRDEIARLRARLGITTLFVTHDQSEALAMSDRIVVMDHGRIVEVADPQQLTEHPTRAFTARFLGARSVLRGAMQPQSDGMLFVADGGARIRVRCDPPAEKPTHIVLRAARLTLDREGAPDGDIAVDAAATVAESVFLGDQRQLVAISDGSRISVLLPADRPAPPVGARVRLRGPADAVSFLIDPQPDGMSIAS